MALIQDSLENAEDGLWNLVKHLEFLQYDHSIEQMKPSLFDFPVGTDFSEPCKLSDLGTDIVKHYLHIGLVNENTLTEPLTRNHILLILWPSFVSPAAYINRKEHLPCIKKVKTMLFHVPEEVFLNYSAGGGSVNEIIAVTAIRAPLNEWKLLEKMVISSFYHLTFDKVTADLNGDKDIWLNYPLEQLDLAWKQLLFLCCGPQTLANLIKRMLKRNWAQLVKESQSGEVPKSNHSPFFVEFCIVTLIEWATFSSKQDTIVKFLKNINSIKPVLNFSEISKKLNVAFAKSELVPKKHKCTLCPFETNLKHVADLHLFSHNGEKPFVCDQCGISYSRPGNLSNHKRSVHQRKLSHKCKYCGKGFLRPSELKCHLAVHAKKKDLEFRCYKCSNIFEDETLLMNHMPSHTDDPTFSCEICCKQFDSQRALTTHVKNHNRARRHVCPVCSEAFFTEYKLSVHLKTHLGRSFKCRFCDKEFKNERSLQKHEVGQHDKVEADMDSMDTI